MGSHDIATASTPYLRPVDHPSFGAEIDAFLGQLQREPRYFGPTASQNPKPFPSLIAKLRERGGFHVAAFDHEHIIGLARVDGAGELYLAVVADHRGAGIGRELCSAALSRARELHYHHVVMRTTKRSRAVRALAERLGCVVNETMYGGVDLVFTEAAADLVLSA